MIIISKSAGYTGYLGECLAKVVETPCVVLLNGELGSGKTTFVKGFLAGKGIAEYSATSPSFVLQNVYEHGSVKIAHVDLYRLERPPEEWRSLIEDYAGCFVLVEWGDRTPLFQDIEGRIIVSFEYLTETSRIIAINAPVNAIKAFGEIMQTELTDGLLRYEYGKS